jgi:hypothetical protein
LDAPGTLHHVIGRGIEGGKIVKDNQDRDNLISRLGALAKRLALPSMDGAGTQWCWACSLPQSRRYCEEINKYNL